MKCLFINLLLLLLCFNVIIVMANQPPEWRYKCSPVSISWYRISIAHNNNRQRCEKNGNMIHFDKFFSWLLLKFKFDCLIRFKNSDIILTCVTIVGFSYFFSSLECLERYRVDFIQLAVNNNNNRRSLRSSLRVQIAIEKIICNFNLTDSHMNPTWYLLLSRRMETKNPKRRIFHSHESSSLQINENLC